MIVVSSVCKPSALYGLPRGDAVWEVNQTLIWRHSWPLLRLLNDWTVYLHIKAHKSSMLRAKYNCMSCTWCCKIWYILSESSCGISMSLFYFCSHTNSPLIKSHYTLFLEWSCTAWHVFVSQATCYIWSLVYTKHKVPYISQSYRYHIGYKSINIKKFVSILSWKLSPFY